MNDITWPADDHDHDIDIENLRRHTIAIHYFLMLVATGSFSPERGLPAIFFDDFNHFKSIIMSALLHRKTLIWSFLNQFRLLFICYQRKFNLLKPSLWICHSNSQTWLECTEKWTGSPFLHMLPPGDLAH